MSGHVDNNSVCQLASRRSSRGFECRVRLAAFSLTELVVKPLSREGSAPDELPYLVTSAKLIQSTERLGRGNCPPGEDIKVQSGAYPAHRITFRFRTLRSR